MYSFKWFASDKTDIDFIFIGGSLVHMHLKYLWDSPDTFAIYSDSRIMK